MGYMNDTAIVSHATRKGKCKKTRRPYAHLAGQMREYEVSQEELGRVLNLSHAAVAKRMDGTTQWRLDEMYRVLDFFGEPPDQLSVYFPLENRR